MTKAFDLRMTFAAALVILAVIAGCTATPATPSASSTPDAPRSGGKMTFVFNMDVAQWDPTRFTGAYGDATWANAVFDTLVHVDAAGKITPRLAESVTTTDQKTWTIKLRPNLKFSDGAPLDADAVVFNWKRKGDPALRAGCLANVQAMESYTAADPVTVRVVLKSQQSQFPRQLQICLGYLGSPKAFQEKGDKIATEPVGAGPFILKQWVRDSSTTFARNPTYWGAPAPYLDELTFRYLSDPQQAYNTLTAGQADSYWTQDNVMAERFRKAGFDMIKPDLVGGLGIAFNVSKPPFDDVRVRQAFAVGIDRNEIVKIATEGTATIHNSFFPENHPLYDANGPKQPGYDPVKAQQLIDAYVAEKGRPISGTFVGVPVYKTMMESLQQQMSRYKGIGQIDIVYPANFFTSIFTHDFNIMVGSINDLDPEPQMYDRLHTVPPGPSTNYGVFSDPEYDAAVEAGRSAGDAAGRKAAYTRAVKVFYEKVPYVHFIRSDSFTIFSKKVRGMNQIERGISIFSHAWLTP